MHKNVSVEADHPFFKQTARDAYFFLFPFRDEKFICVVEAQALYEQVLAKKQLRHSLSRNYYVVSPIDVNGMDKSNVMSIPVVENCKTFGDFFNKNFKGDELTNLNENEIWSYANDVVAEICRKNIIDYDIPEN